MKTVRRPFHSGIAASLTALALSVRAGGDALAPAPPGAVSIGGRLGERMGQALRNRVMAQDVRRLTEPFRARAEHNAGHWRGEYWGKWFTSAALAWAAWPSPELRAQLERALDELLATRTPDGYIGTWRDSARFGPWDIWGRKYTLLGLLAAHELLNDPRALPAARDLAAHLRAQLEADHVRVADTGLDVLQGLASSSVLLPLARLGALSGEPQWSAFAEAIVQSWSEPGRWTPSGLRLIEAALEDRPPATIASRKAYEMMSCFEGIAELSRLNEASRYREAVVRFAESLRRRERMIIGSGSNQELWCDGATFQTEQLEQPVETCVTVTWMHLCEQVLRLTGNPLWADELELSLYNALLSAMMPDGGWWAYFSPLAGQRVASHVQHPDVGLSCCVANGPRALFAVPRWAVMRAPDGGPVINLYAPMTIRWTLPDGTPFTIEVRTSYPREAPVEIALRPAEPRRCTLRFRIPEWSARTRLQINGADAPPPSAGQYATVEREWTPGDMVRLELDLRARVVSAPSGAPAQAVLRGPIVLALDDRFVPPTNLAVRLALPTNEPTELATAAASADVELAVRVPFEVRPSHYFHHHTNELVLCDYASAGNRWDGTNSLRVWLPRPLYLRTAYPPDTWRLMYPRLTEPPRIPAPSAAPARHEGS